MYNYKLIFNKTCLDFLKNWLKSIYAVFLLSQQTSLYIKKICKPKGTYIFDNIHLNFKEVYISSLYSQKWFIISWLMKVPIFWALSNFMYYWNLRNLTIKCLRQGWKILYPFIHLNVININFSTHHLSTYMSYVNVQSTPPCKVEMVVYGWSKWKIIEGQKVSSSPSWANSKNKLGSEEMDG